MILKDIFELLLKNIKHMISPLISASQITSGYHAIIRCVNKVELATNQKIIHNPTTRTNAKCLESILFASMIITPLIIDDINISIEFNWLIFYFDVLKNCYTKRHIEILQQNWTKFNELCVFYFCLFGCALMCL